MKRRDFVKGVAGAAAVALIAPVAAKTQAAELGLPALEPEGYTRHRIEAGSTPRRLRVDWTVEMDEDLNNWHG